MSRFRTNPKVIFIYYTQGQKLGRIKQTNSLEEAQTLIKEYKEKGFRVSLPAYLS